jgi:hypothetical protein
MNDGLANILFALVANISSRTNTSYIFVVSDLKGIAYHTFRDFVSNPSNPMIMQWMIPKSSGRPYFYHGNIYRNIMELFNSYSIEDCFYSNMGVKDINSDILFLEFSK